MKHFFLILGLFFLTFSGFSQKYPQNAIKINPFGSFASAIPVVYERMILKQKFSLQGGATAMYGKSGSGQSTYNSEGLILSPEIRYYMYSDSLQNYRIYLSGFIKYESYTNSTLDRIGNVVKGKSKGTGIGILFGNQWYVKNRIVFDIFIGPGYTQYSNSENYNLNIEKGGLLTSFSAPKNTGLKVRMGLMIGLCF